MKVFLAETPGTHTLTPICGSGYVDLSVLKFYYCSITVDTLISSGLAILVTLAICFFIVNRLRSGVPGKLQLVLEFLLGYVRDLTHETVGEGADFVIPLAATIGLYILVANWLDFFPLAGPVLPANADLNQTFAMALVVFLVSQGYAIKVRGFGGYLRHYMRPPYPPLTIIEEIVKPVTLSLRLFGNIFAGLLMVYLLGLLWGTLSPLWAPVSVIGLVLWKAFDVFFVGTIQAFIFMLLTIIYFGQAREGLEEEGHQASHTAGSAPAAAARPPAATTTTRS